MTKLGAPFVRRFLAAPLAALVLLLAGPALAGGGRVEWKSKKIAESDSHSWLIDVAIYMNSTPDVATLPMRFSFEPVVYYERAMVDGKDGPQLRSVPLQNKPPMVESVDVGFLDPSSGSIQKRTRFSFKVSRIHGYEAGEYDVTVRDGRTDAALGQSVHLIFDGENEVIDRRAVVFSGEKKKKESSDDAPKPQEEKRQLTPDDPAYWQGGPKNADDDKKEEVEPKRGCGCRVGATEPGVDRLGAGALVTMLGLSAARRRRRTTRQPVSAT